MESAIKSAIIAGDLEGFERALAGGEDLHAGEESALSFAVSLGHASMVKRLIECGADIHARGGTFIYISIYDCNTEIVDILLASGARDRYDRFLTSVPEAAAECGSGAILSRVITHFRCGFEAIHPSLLAKAINNTLLDVLDVFMDWGYPMEHEAIRIALSQNPEAASHYEMRRMRAEIGNPSNNGLKSSMSRTQI